MIAGRGAGVFVEETDGKGRMRAPLPERANAAVLQPTGKHNIAEDVPRTPEDLAAEGKTILTLRLKSADELERQLRQPSHRSSMPQYAHACSTDRGGQDVRPKANATKIIRSSGEKGRDSSRVAFRVVAGDENEECGEKERRVFAVSHMSPE